MGRVERPQSFDADAMGDWEDWVLEHGVPQDLPETIGVGEVVPVACWRDDTWAAVLHLEYREAVADPEHPAFDEPAGIDDETQTFRRAGDRWEAAGGSGGGSWFEGLRLRPPDIGDDEAIALGHAGGIEPGWACGAVRGVAGQAARTVEVEQGARVLVRPIDSRVGAWVAAYDGDRPAVVRVRDAAGAVLLEHVAEPLGRWPRWLPPVPGHHAVVLQGLPPDDWFPGGRVGPSEPGWFPCPSEGEPMASGRLSDEQRDELRELLVAEREGARRRLGSLVQAFEEMVDAADLEPPDDEHDPDGTTAYERAQVSSLAGEARQRLSQVERALHELDEGRYGDCERCGEAIGWERLLARPGTTTCVPCAG